MKNVIPSLKVFLLCCFMFNFASENFAQQCTDESKVVKVKTGTASLPDSPTGIAAQKLINTITDGSEATIKAFVNNEMTDNMRDFAPMEQHLQIFNSIHKDYSDMEIVGLSAGSQYGLTFMGQSGKSGKMIKITLEVAKEASHLIESVSFQPNASFGGQDASVSIESSEGLDDISKTLSFYNVPLTCGAAPEIGCGIATKPVLMDLQNQKSVKSAFLNRSGTIIAVSWNESTSKADRDAAVHPVFKEFGMTMNEFFGEEYKKVLTSFNSDDPWYEGKEVDKLSMEEAAEIGRKLTSLVRNYREISKEDAAKMETDIRTFFEEELTKDGRNSMDWTSNVKSMVEKYIGEGNFPSELKIQLGVRSQKERAENKSCASPDDEDCSKSCCKS